MKGNPDERSIQEFAERIVTLTGIFNTVFYYQRKKMKKKIILIVL